MPKKAMKREIIARKLTELTNDKERIDILTEDQRQRMINRIKLDMIESAEETNYYDHYFNIKTLSRVNKTIKGNVWNQPEKNKLLMILHRFIKYTSACPAC